MGDQTSEQVSQAISNLSADTMADVRGAQTPLQQVTNEVEAVYDEYDWVSDCIPRARVHCEVTDSFKSKHGQAQYNRKTANGPLIEGHHVIRIAEQIVGEDEHDWRDTVRHELAHVLAYERNGQSSPGHGPLWKETADDIGAEPSRCASSRHTDGDYLYGCPNGCWQTEKHKRSKKIKKPGRRSCSTCGAHCVSWPAGESRPVEPGYSAVDCSDLVDHPSTPQYRYGCVKGCWESLFYTKTRRLQNADNRSCGECGASCYAEPLDK